MLVRFDRRSLRIAYVLCLVFGTLGAHRIYCNRSWGYCQGGITVVGSAAIIVAALELQHGGMFYVSSVSWWATELFASGLAMIGVTLVWTILDAFRIPRWMRAFNRGRCLLPSGTGG